MKSKGKKAEKKQTVTSSKKDEKKVAVEVPVIRAATEPSENVGKTTPKAAPVIEVLAEEPKKVVPVIEERKGISADERRRLISLAAYYRAQKVGFGKTNPVEDWLLAEREVDAMITTGHSI